MDNDYWEYLKDPHEGHLASRNPLVDGEAYLPMDRRTKRKQLFIKLTTSIRSFLAILAAGAISLGVNNANARQQSFTNLPSGLPSALPIGDELTIRNWEVSTNGTIEDIHVANSHSFFSWLYWYDTQGMPDYIYWQYTGYGFDSYDLFVQRMANDGMFLREQLSYFTNYPPSNPVYFMVSVDYYFAALSQHVHGMYLMTNVGPLSLITTNMLVNALPLSLEPQSEYVVMTTPGLSFVKIEVDTPTACWYTWSNGVSSSSSSWNTYRPQNQPDSTCPGYLALSHWYSTGKYRVRITLTVNCQRSLKTSHVGSNENQPL